MSEKNAHDEVREATARQTDSNKCLELYDATTLCLGKIEAIIEMAWKSDMHESAIYVLEDQCKLFRQTIDKVREDAYTQS